MLTEFFDSVAPNTTIFSPPSDDSFSEGYTPSLSLAEWFQRPVKIKTYDWVEGTSILNTIDPWTLYFSNAEIYAKLKGFSRMQATLHIKLTINASPYQYGAGLISYVPMTNMTSNAPAVDSFAGGFADPAFNGYDISVAGTVPGNLIVKTCRPHAWFYPQFSKGCEMVLPFCYYKNWLNLDTVLSELTTLGKLTVYTPVPLATTGTTTINPVSITIFAWCDMHKVSAPSYAMQGGDEYVDRPVSTTMSALSTLARSVARVPTLRPYAMATSSVLASMGAAARWFGFSNPPIIADIHALRPNFMASYSSPEICVQHEKLALDPKNEVTVDSRTVGLDGVDHMAISHIVGRDVSFGVIAWGATTVATTCLAVFHVTPMVYLMRTFTGATTQMTAKSIQMTPSCQIGTLFDFWHGPITYKFAGIASQFHRGRLLVSYDPDGFKDTYTSAAYVGPRTISKIWDIAENPTFEFEIPWVAPTAFLKTGGLAAMCAAGTNSARVIYINPSALPGTWNFLDASHNGSIVVSVLNALTSGSTTAGVSLVCSMNCAGVEYANPRELGIPLSISSYNLQSGDDVLAADPDEVQTASIPAYTMPVQHTIYTGEIVRSIRTLMHRTNLYMRVSTMTDGQTVIGTQSAKIPGIVVAGVSTSSTPQAIKSYSSSLLLPMCPYVPGAGTAARLTGIMIRDGSTTDVPANRVDGMYLGIPTITSYLTPSYVGFRGSTIYHARKADRPYVSTTVPFGTVTDMSISRSFRSVATMFTGFTIRTPFIWRTMIKADISQPTAALGALQFFNYIKTGIGFSTSGAGGFSVTNPSHVDVVDAVVPWYCNFRMAPANPQANVVFANAFNSLSWNYFDRNAENIGMAQASLNVTVDFTDDCPNTIANLFQHPVLDIYHKAGVDYTAFWYLNPPTIQMYVNYADGYPSGWT